LIPCPEDDCTFSKLWKAYKAKAVGGQLSKDDAAALKTALAAEKREHPQSCVQCDGKGCVATVEDQSDVECVENIIRDLKLALEYVAAALKRSSQSSLPSQYIIDHHKRKLAQLRALLEKLRTVFVLEKVEKGLPTFLDDEFELTKSGKEPDNIAEMRKLIEKFQVLFFKGRKGFFRIRKPGPMGKEGKLKFNKPRNKKRRPKGVTLINGGSSKWEWKYPDTKRRLGSTDTCTLPGCPGSISLECDVTSPSTSTGITKPRIPAPTYSMWAPFAMILMLFCVLCWILRRRLRTPEPQKRSKFTRLGVPQRHELYSR